MTNKQEQMVSVKERLSMRVAQRRVTGAVKQHEDTYYSFGDQDASTCVVSHFNLPKVFAGFDVGLPVACDDAALTKAVTEVVGRVCLFEKGQLYPEDDEQDLTPFWRVTFQQQFYKSKLPIRGGAHVTLITERIGDGGRMRLLGDIRWNCNAATQTAMLLPTFVVVNAVSFEIADEPVPQQLLRICDFSEDVLENLLFVLSDAGTFVYTKVLPYLRFDVNQWACVAAGMMAKLGFVYKRIDLPTPEIIQRVFRLKHAASLINQTAILNEKVEEKLSKSKKKRDQKKKRKQDRVAAAVRIQAAWRSRFYMRRYEQLRAAAVVSQSFVRACMVRTRVREWMDGLLRMRSFLRSRCVEAENDVNAVRVARIFTH